MKEIKLTKGYTALVDDNLFKELNKFKWHVAVKNSGPYAVRNTRKLEYTIFNSSCIYMTKYILFLKNKLNITINKVIDHKNGNTLDNQYNNLRVCTNTQNIRNSKKPITNTSGIKGVYWDKNRNKWHAQIKVNNKVIFLGRFSSKIEATEIHDKAAVKYHGEFARLNNGC